MPRERITPFHYPGVVVGGPDDGKPFEAPQMVIDIGWTNGMPGVGVHTQPTKNSTRILLESINNWLQRVNMPQVDVDKLLSLDPAAADVGGFNTTLDTREDINRLIRVLRRARDAAFGKDA